MQRRGKTMAKVVGTDNDDVIIAASGVTNGNDTISGLGGDDRIIGLGGDDIIDGGAGNDVIHGNVTIVGGAIVGTNDADFIDGSAGNEVIVALGGNDFIVAGVGDDIRGGDGVDTVSFADSNEGVSMTLSFTGDFQGSGGTAERDTYTSIENVIGSDFNDILQGDDSNNVLFGGGGNDLFISDRGADTILGGDGTDTMQYEGSAVNVSLLTGVAHGGDAEGDHLVSIENLTGTNDDDVLEGDNGANVLNGHGGNDILRGDAGNDIINGGDGNDILIGGAGADTLNGGFGVTGGDGIDTASYADSASAVFVNLATGIGHGGDAEGDRLSLIDNLIGSQFNDTLIGDANANRLDGGAGADILDGGPGNDTVGYSGSAAAVSVDLTTGIATGGDAQGDTLLEIENLVGSRFNDTLRGNDGSNVIDGGSGADKLTGGAGADTFVWHSTADTGTTPATADTVTDFNLAEGDKLDLSAIDANATATGQQHFSFIGTAGFTAAGQINWFTDGHDTFIEMNTNADDAPEATIRIQGVHTVEAAWFNL
jgi:Ca2+-binding RTX toxin-like protein